MKNSVLDRIRNNLVLSLVLLLVISLTISLQIVLLSGNASAKVGDVYGCCQATTDHGPEDFSTETEADCNNKGASYYWQSGYCVAVYPNSTIETWGFGCAPSAAIGEGYHGQCINYSDYLKWQPWPVSAGGYDTHLKCSNILSDTETNQGGFGPEYYCLCGADFYNVSDGGYCCDHKFYPTLSNELQNCGACGNVCPTGNSCIQGVCGLSCGDKVAGSGEQCDGPDLKGNSCKSVGSIFGLDLYDDGNLLCTSPSPTVNGCTFDISQCNYCGDKHIDSAYEQCDNGTVTNPLGYVTDIEYNGKPCSVTYGGADCSYCSADCKSVAVKAPYCGDGTCQSGYENSKNCIADCGVDGWDLAGTWSLTSDNKMFTKGLSSFVTNETKSFTLKAGNNYVLSAMVFNPGNCKFNISLMTSCVSATTWQPVDKCFAVTQEIDQNSPGLIGAATGWDAANIIFHVDPGKYNDSDAYYKELRLKVMVGSCSDQGIYLDNISLRDSKFYDDQVHYDYTGNFDAATGCCPDGWCWDGNQCVDSFDYMNDSQKSPIWNNVLDSAYFNWTNEHVNSSYADLGYARGYRCVLNNDSANAYSYWAPSSIKYDWDNKYSGYCAQESECFVNSTANYDNTTYNNIYGNVSYDCIPNATFVNDAFELDKGNHYCLNGEWATKSYVVASAMQWIAQQEIKKDDKYIIFCDEPDKVFNTKAYNSMIEAACGLIIKKSKSGNDPGEISVIGIVPKEANKEYMDNMLDNDIGSQYGLLYNITGDMGLEYAAGLNLIQPEPGTDFYQLVSRNDNHLRVYYNNRTKYFLISSNSIHILEPTIWESIRNFFRGIFGYPPTRKDYGLMNFTTNFDRIYLLRNSSMSVTGLEEAKYDEYNYSILTYLWINYTGSDSNTNRINYDYIAQMAKPMEMSTAYGALIIKTQKPTGLWEYLTAMLRDRDTNVTG